jgi:starch synthase
MKPRSELDVRALFVAAEAFPLAKTGGLADVCGALPAALARLDVDIVSMIPGYPQALDTALAKENFGELDLPLANRLVAGISPLSGLPVILFDCPALFRRGGALYQNADGEDWRDNDRRFLVFCQAAAQVALGRTRIVAPDIVHAHDWHAGLVPALLRFAGKDRPRTLFTIHNLAFQGNFPLDIFQGVGLPGDALSPDGLEFFGRGSFLKAGIRYSDRLTTVSPTYAREILTPEHGCGMDGLLRSRSRDIVGILNGIDYDVWDPAVDAALPARYSAEDLSGKEACKADIRAALGLERDSGAPLMIYVNRLTHQKMADVILDALPPFVESGAQLVVHGLGEPAFETMFAAAAAAHPGQVAVRLGYDESLAHRIIAAADLSLTPSRFEPCGLTTMYAMRYGAVPVTRRVGGLADTVSDAHAAGGTGFVFEGNLVQDLIAGVERALARYERRDSWAALQRRAMKRNFGWERSAARYREIYLELLGRADAEGSDADCSQGRLAAE